MTVLPHIRSMAFFNANSLDLSYGFAQRFAGEDGHIATLAEIITARAKQSENSYLWRNWFTTSSAEFYGHSRAGTPIIIVAHGVGPLDNLTAIQEAYESDESRQKQGSRGLQQGEGYISLEQFRLLEDGHYGEVTIVEAAFAADIYPYPYMSAADMAQAERDLHLQARLGEDWWMALEMMRQASLNEGVDYAGNAPKVVSNEGPTFYSPNRADDNWPYAHLLSVGTTTLSHACRQDGGDRISFDVSCHQRSNSMRFIGVRSGGDVVATHQGPTLLDYERERLTLPNPLPTGDSDFFALYQLNTEWFTQTRKAGRSLDTCWPEYPVTELEIVGATGKIVALGEMFFFRYDIDVVIDQAPPEANAYYISSDCRHIRVDGTEGIEADVTFCRVEIDESRKVPARAVFDADYDLQMEMLERIEGMPSSA